MVHKTHSNSKGRILEGDIINTPININQIQSNFKYDTKDLPKLIRSPTRDGNSYQIGINVEKYIWKEHQTSIMVQIVPKSQTYHDSWTFNMKDNYL